MLVGREREVESIGRLLAAAEAGTSGALVLRGEPGVGKTALLRHAVERSGAMLVLRATGFESEAELEFSGLLEVCRPLLGSLDALSPAQREALSAALGVGEPGGHDRFVVAAATLELIAAAAEISPVLVVVDDAHWLDGSSLAALLFAARRLTVDPVAFLFATRPEGLVGSGLDEIALGGLDATAAAALVDSAVSVEVAPAVMSSLLEATAGNPLGLLELPAGLSEGQLAGREPILAPVLAGGAVERAFAGRLAALSADGRSAASVLAASDGSAVAPVVGALEQLGIPLQALAECEDATVVSFVGDRFSFSHPLLRAAAYEAVGPSARRAAHRALADALSAGDLERRAWHLALSAVPPDDDAADALEAAATAAAARHAVVAAAGALERASTLSSDPRRRSALALSAAEACWAAGRPVRALELGEGLLVEGIDDGLRERALRVVGRVELQVGGADRAYALLCESAELAAPTDPVRAAGTLYFACLALYVQGRIEEQVELAQHAVGLDGPGSVTGRTVPGYMLGQALTMAGRVEEARPWLESALTTLRDEEVTTTGIASRRAAFCLYLLGRPSEAAATAEHALAEARARGPLDVTWALNTLVRILFQTGDWARADGVATEALELCRALDQAGTTTEVELTRACIAAARGDQTTCRSAIERASTHAGSVGWALSEEALRWARGRLALAHDRLDEAVELLADCAASVGAMGLLEREVAPEPDLVEALVRLGRPADAREALDRWTTRGALRATPWGPPLVEALEGLLADDGGLDAPFGRSLELHVGLADPYLEARTRLLYGERLRRAGRRVDARLELRAAHATFERLGCDPWADRARRELRASGERLRSAVASGDELTAQEREIALQVAAGKANKEVAAALFLSPKTVEFHLSRIYRKLEISSRAELVLRFAVASAQVE